MKRKIGVAALALALAAAPGAAEAQSLTVGIPLVSLGVCHLTATGTAALLSTAICASFTATASGTALTTTSVTGFIRPGATIAGTGVPTGTTILSQTSGTPGGAGVYVTSVATTASSASTTATGIPVSSNGQPANLGIISVETANIRWADDGSVPTTTVGMPIAAAAAPFVYTGTLSLFELIAQSASPVVNVAYYRSQ